MSAVYSVTNIPADPARIAAARLTRAPGHKMRMRGRGKRGSSRKLHQDLPLNMADRFTLYVEAPRESAPPFTGSQHIRFEYRGLGTNGKLIVRQVSHRDGAA